MLKIIQRGEKLNTPCALLLGGFDGLHVGHQTLIAAAKQYGEVGLTAMVGCKSGGNIFTLAERAYLYERAGVCFAYYLPFTEQFQSTSAEDFMQEIQRAVPLTAVVCGTDFRFGRGAAGDIALLKRTLSCPVEALPLMKIGSEKVSSSQVKKYLSEGGVSEANTLLSHPYFVMGKVEKGRGVGRTMGFPTVNVSFPQEKFPLREGVYGGYVQTPKGEYSAVIHFGARPTFGVREQKIEAFLQGFEGDLYGETVRVYPTQFLRPVQKFSSVEELKQQIERDKKRLKV